MKIKNTLFFNKILHYTLLLQCLDFCKKIISVKFQVIQFYNTFS